GNLSSGSHGGSIDWPLILQLAALVTLTVALARPIFGFGAGADHRLYVLETSYEMLSTENNERVLDLAIDWLEQELLELPPSVAVTVVAAGRHPQVLAIRSRGATGAALLDDVETWATGANYRK